MKKESKFFEIKERREIARPGSIEELSRLERGEILEVLHRDYTGQWDKETAPLNCISRDWDKCFLSYSIFWGAEEESLVFLEGNFSTHIEYKVPMERIQIEKGILWIYESKKILERYFCHGGIEDLNEKEKLILRNNILFIPK